MMPFTESGIAIDVLWGKNKSKSDKVINPEILIKKFKEGDPNVIANTFDWIMNKTKQKSPKKLTASP